VTILLTEDNQIAGAVSSELLRGNAVGIAAEVSQSAATVELFCGLTITGNPYLDETSVGEYAGQLVRVTSYGKNVISLSRVDYGGNHGELDVAGRKVGTAPLANNVRIYEKVGRGALTAINLSAIPTAKVPSSKVLYAEKDYAGRVKILVLGDVTGDPYVYGKLDFEESENGNSSIAVENGNGLSQWVVTHSGHTDGAYGGLAFCKNERGENRIAAEAKLTKLADVSNSQWNGNGTVTVSGKTYTVADDVACYNETTGKWVTLAQARAFSDVADLYFDGVGEKIRIVAVRQPK